MRTAPIEWSDGYVVTESGEVFNKHGRKLKPCLNTKTGYLQLGLRLAGAYKTVRVHRLVAEAFVPNPAGLCEVNHIDGNKQNNIVANLEWTNKRGNALHAYRTGLRAMTAVSAYTMDGKLYKTFPSVKEAMAFCGVDYNAGISNCLRGKAKTAYGYIWRYAEGGHHERLDTVRDVPRLS